MIEHLNLFIMIISLIFGFGIYIYLLNLYKKYSFKTVFNFKRYIFIYTSIIFLHILIKYFAINLVFLNEYDFFIIIRTILTLLTFLLYFFLYYYILKFLNNLEQFKYYKFEKYIYYLISTIFLYLFVKELIVFLRIGSIYKLIEIVNNFKIIAIILVLIILFKNVLFYKEKRDPKYNMFFYFHVFLIIVYSIKFFALILEYEILSYVYIFHNSIIILFLLEFLNNYYKKDEIIKIHNKLLDENLNKKGITNREMDIVNLILEGKTNKEIAEELYISVKTVKYHIYNIFKKLEIKNRIELINYINNFEATE